jgi:hypothetical protein
MHRTNVVPIVPFEEWNVRGSGGGASNWYVRSTGCTSPFPLLKFVRRRTGTSSIRTHSTVDVLVGMAHTTKHNKLLRRADTTRSDVRFTTMPPSSGSKQKMKLELTMQGW